MKKVSIIIPVYRVEEYLEECLDSILRQTYQNLQILLIDDESPDRCPEICEEYAGKDERIEVIHQKNRGAAGARNRGLEQMRGEYICFVDSDDRVKENYVERLVDQLEIKDAQIAVCSFQNFYRAGLVEEFAGANPKSYRAEEYLEWFLQDWSCGLIWNKIFRREVLENVRFEEGHKIDDEFFTYKTVMNAKKVQVFDEILYEYRMRRSGVMHSSGEYQESVLQDRLEYLTERYELVTKNYPQLGSLYLQNLTDNLIRLWRESMPYEIHQKVIEVTEKYCKKILFGPIPLKAKYGFLMRNRGKQVFSKGVETKIQENQKLFL